MKIALVHDQLYEFGGAERVFLTFCQMFPQASIYTSFVNYKNLKRFAPELLDREIKTSFVQKIPFINKLYSPLRFIAPKIWESFDFSDYDLVISSSGWYMCKGITTKTKKQLNSETIKQSNNKPIHISYIHHPPRYLYGYETAREWQKYWPIKIYGIYINHYLRTWDFKSSQRPDLLIANSQETKKRIKKFYRREAMVIYPPVQIPSEFEIPKNKKSSFAKASVDKQESTYYITVSRLQKAKHVEILIKAANETRFNLKIVGDGKDQKYLKSLAGSTVEFLGRVDDVKLNQLYKDAKAFLFASVDEEFGIAPIEAMGHGIPVIAYASGGLLETIKDQVNGFLYHQLNNTSISRYIKVLEKMPNEKYLQMCKNARKEAEKYSQEIFKKKILEFINNQISF